VQGVHEYFRIVEGTCIIVLCLSLLSISLLYPLHKTLNFVQDSELYQTLNTGLSFKNKEEKDNTIQPPVLCFSHLQTAIKPKINR